MKWGKEGKKNARIKLALKAIARYQRIIKKELQKK